jgi:neutral ceramidase
LQGEKDPDPGYIHTLCAKTAEAAEEAVSRLQPAGLWMTTVRVPGLTYNRRAVLSDGRVSMALEPDAPVLERGPVDDALTALVFRSPGGEVLSALVHFACHGAAVCSQTIQGDIPGEVSRRVADLFEAPCLYLQGCTGDVNPLGTSSGRPAMLAWMERLAPYLESLPVALQPVPGVPLRVLNSALPVLYEPLPERAAVLAKIDDLDRIAGGEVDSPEVQGTLRLLGDLMNFKPGERPDPAKAAFAAAALAGAERRTLAAIDSGQPLPVCPLRVSLWRVGQVGFAFVAAELFAATGFQIRAASRGLALLPAPYAASIIGYIPDEAAIEKGGYEVNDAWRFYCQPAPFQSNTERRLVELIRSMAITL